MAMKRINDYTEEELCELTKEQISDITDLECAHKGVRLAIEKPKKPEDSLPEPDTTVYEISGLKVTEYDEAQALINFINSLKSKVDIDWRSSYERRYISGKLREQTYKETKVYSQETYDKLSAEIANFEERKKDFRKQNDEYEEVMKEREEIAKEVQSKINEANATYRRIALLKKVTSILPGIF